VEQDSLPHQGDLGRGEGAGSVDEVAEGAFQGLGFRRSGAGGLNVEAVFVS